MAENRGKRRQGRSSGTRILMVLTLLGGLVFLAMIGVAVWLVTSVDTGKVSDRSFLRVELSGAVQDAPSVGGFVLDPADLPPVPTSIARAIREAADDDRIHGLYLELDTPVAGWGVLQELRSAVQDFRESGKPCVAYASSYQTADYYLASACDRVVVAPGGVTLVSGLSTSITYYAGAFEKLGVDPEFEHVGEFKSAVEPYERTEPSEGAVAAYNSFLDSIWGTVVADIAQSRGMSPEQFQAVVDHPPMSPDDALERGLVDAIAYPDAVEAHLAGALEEGWVELLRQPAPVEDQETREKRFTKVREYVKNVEAEDAWKTDRIAVIYAEGPIVTGDGDGGLFGGQMLADGPFAEWMEEAREDESVKAVVLRVNSPGGSTLASDMMWNEIKRTQAAGKPVVVSMANYAASGGYYIAAPADWVVAQPSTLTGSIGIFGGKLTLGGTYEKLGLTEYQFKRGELANLLSITQPFSEQGREVFRAYLHDFYDIFLGRVAEGRGMSREQVHELARGRVWTGEQALERKLVDELGGLDTALGKAAELAGIEDYGLERLPKQKGFLDTLMEDLASAKQPTITIGAPIPGLEEGVQELILLDRILEGNGVAAYLPGELTVE